MSRILLDQRIIKVLYVLSSIVLLFLVAESYLKFYNVRSKSAELSKHNHQRTHLLEVFNAFNQVETSTRGFILLHDSTFLLSRSEGLKRYSETGRELENALIENTPEHDKYRNLIEFFNKRLNQIDTMILTEDKFLRDAYLNSSAEVLSLSREKLNQLIAVEEDYINSLADDISNGIYSAPGNILALSSIFILFLIISFFYLNRQLVRSRKLKESASELNIALSKNQEFLKSILNANPDNIIAYEAVRDDQGKIIDFITIFAAGTKKIQPVTLVGKKASELYPNLNSTSFIDQLIRITESGIPEYSQVYYPYDGVLGGWYETRITKYNDGVIINGRNINDIKKVETDLTVTIEQLNRSNEQLRQFNHVTSHDLQEPLRKMQLFANEILYKEQLSEKMITNAESLKDTATNLSTLISGIARYTSLESIETNYQLTDLNLILSLSLNDLEEVITKSSAEIVTNTLPAIYCDPVQIEQLFTLLLNNSLKLNKNRPQISIKYSQVTDPVVLASLNSNLQWFHLTYTDNATGFSRGYGEQLFNIFERLPGNRLYSGTGIGLVICKQIVENHSGTITAYASESSGAIFDIYLPFKPDSATA